MTTGRLLLDTHVWLWLAFGTPEKLRPGTRKALEQAGASNPLLVSIISVWEVALLESKKRLRLPMSVNEWVERALDRPEIRLIGLERARTVIDSCRLPGDFHPDPADRLLVATAQRENAVFVTRDRKILEYGGSGHVRVMAARAVREETPLGNRKKAKTNSSIGPRAATAKGLRQTRVLSLGGGRIEIAITELASH